MRHSLKRINTYRALASPAWISLTSPDPILTAFRLSWELERLALRENEFKDTYIELSNQCQKCACDLLDQCRSSEEVIAVLNKESDAESGDELDGGDDEKLTLARLKLAIKYEQKEVGRAERRQSKSLMQLMGANKNSKNRRFRLQIVIHHGSIFVQK